MRLALLLLVALALRAFRLLAPLTGRRLTLRLLLLLPLLLVALSLRAFRLPPLDCGGLTLRLLALWRGTLALRFRRARADARLLAAGLLLTRAWGRPGLRLFSGLLPTLFGALPLGRGGCGLLSGGQSAARRAWWVVKEAALLTRTQRLQLGRPGCRPNLGTGFTDRDASTIRLRAPQFLGTYLQRARERYRSGEDDRPDLERTQRSTDICRDHGRGDAWVDCEPLIPDHHGPVHHDRLANGNFAFGPRQ